MAEKADRLCSLCNNVVDVVQEEEKENDGDIKKKTLITVQGAPVSPISSRLK